MTGSPNPAKPSRLFLADHMLRDVVGHHLGYNLAVADAASRAGIEPCLVTHTAFDPSLAAGVPCRRIFHTDVRAEPPAWIANNPRLLGLLEKWCSGQFRRDLRGLSGAGESGAVFAQMLAPRHFLQWLRWMANQPSPPILFMQLGYRPGRFVGPDIAAALSEFPRAVMKRVIFVTDSEKLIEPFEKALGRVVHYLPHIISYEFPQPKALTASRPVVVFAPGNARREKGFAEIMAAIRLINGSSASDRFHFIVQCHDPDRICAEVLRGLMPENVERIDHPLAESDYVERMGRSDVVLVPYHLDLYEERTSGIFCEARVAGKPVIASERSWAGDRVAREGGGWLVREKDEVSLINCLNAVPETLEQKASEARDLRQQACGEFHRDGFLKGLIRLFQGAPHEVV